MFINVTHNRANTDSVKVFYTQYIYIYLDNVIDRLKNKNND